MEHGANLSHGLHNCSMRLIEVGGGAVFTWSSCAIHGISLLHAPLLLLLLQLL